MAHDVPCSVNDKHGHMRRRSRIRFVQSSLRVAGVERNVGRIALTKRQSPKEEDLYGNAPKNHATTIRKRFSPVKGDYQSVRSKPTSILRAVLAHRATGCVEKNHAARNQVPQIAHTRDDWLPLR